MDSLPHNPTDQAIAVTGAAGFIGSAVVREALARGYRVVAIDCLTYAGNLESLAEIDDHPGFRLEKVDICDRAEVDRVLDSEPFAGILHLAAESHVDRSIDGPAAFLRTNVEGTFQLLEAVRRLLSGPLGRERPFRFLHVSTDEVFGDLGEAPGSFSEDSRYQPSSPYSATKAASDHLVRSWGRTYGLPFVVAHCSNNYGPRQFPEKLIPHMIVNALEGRSLPIYGDGTQVRDWLHVEDNARALLDVFERGAEGESFNIGGDAEARNIELVRELCAVLDDQAGDRRPAAVDRYEDLITFVEDRPGHDRRYAIDASKVAEGLGWKPRESLSTGLRKTVRWYLDNESWWRRILSGEYRLERRGTPSLAAAAAF